MPILSRRATCFSEAANSPRSLACCRVLAHLCNPTSDSSGIPKRARVILLRQAPINLAPARNSLDASVSQSASDNRCWRQRQCQRAVSHPQANVIIDLAAVVKFGRRRRRTKRKTNEKFPSKVVPLLLSTLPVLASVASARFAERILRALRVANSFLNYSPLPPFLSFVPKKKRPSFVSYRFSALRRALALN